MTSTNLFEKMHNSKLFTLIKGLKPEEIRWFQKFLKSPFYNTNEQHLKLFDYIKKYYPDLDSPKLSKEATCKKLFPKQAFNIQKIRKLMHGLTILVEEFIVVMRLKNNTYQKKRLLVTELGERNVYDLFQKGTEELVEELKALPYRDAFFFQEMQVLNLEYYGHVETNKQTTDLTHLKSTIDYLDNYYLLQRQRLNYAIKEHEKLFARQVEIDSLEQNHNKLQENPTFKLYELLHKTLTSANDETIYLEIENLFKAEIEKINRNSQLEIIRFLLNYYSGKINSGEKMYISKTLTLYKFGLKQNLLIKNNQLGEVTFNNIATIGVLEQEYDWVTHFIEDYKKYLPASTRKDTTSLSLGLLFFYKKEYNKTIDLLLNQTFANPLHILKSKSILLRTYFEQFLLDDSYFDLLILQSHAFEKFVRRNDAISRYKKESYLNFTLFIRKIVQAISENNLDISLFHKIKKTKAIILKPWLLEKIKATL